MIENKTSDPGEALGRLNRTEREVLTLLAQGHTAKSIGVSLGVSEAAVNERLRAARRKTGVGSSRELARLLAQENRDDFSGLGDAPTPASSPEPRAPKRRWNSRRNIMIAAGAAAVAAIALFQSTDQTQPPAPAEPGPEATLVARLTDQPDPQELRNRVRSEPRDEDWATAIELRIRENYGRTPAVARALETLSVSCGATICEVIGRTRTNASSDDVAAVLGDVQSGEISAAMQRLGLRTMLSAFTQDPDRPGAIAFAAYLEKQ